MPIRKKLIGKIVDNLLGKYVIIKPPVAVESIAKKLGLHIRFQPLESNLSGFIFRDKQAAIIGVNSTQAKVRQRFTISHELGHFLLHQNDNLLVDRVLVKLRSGSSSKETDIQEIEANYFAAELLMPRYLIAEDLENIGPIDIFDEDFIINLAKRYDVSTQALVLRLSGLGYIEH